MDMKAPAHPAYLFFVLNDDDWLVMPIFMEALIWPLNLFKMMN
jgi:hypothetical protein